METPAALQIALAAGAARAALAYYWRGWLVAGHAIQQLPEGATRDEQVAAGTKAIMDFAAQVRGTELALLDRLIAAA